MINDPEPNEHFVVVECDACGFKERYDIFADHLDPDLWDKNNLNVDLDMNGWVEGEHEKQFCIDCAEALGLD